MARKPRALRPGDLVGVVAPAGPVDEERLKLGVAELESLGFAVRVADGVLEREGFTAGTVENRLEQLHGFFADGAVAAIACARGGAGTIHLLPRLDLELLRENPKPVLGYSDVTLLHLVMEGLGIASLHGPMVARELADGDAAYDRASLWHALTGEGEPYETGPDDLMALAEGTAEGVLRGGCLSLLAAAAGTPWAPRGRDETILFLEDVDEKPYRIDRMLRQLRASGALEGVNGIVFGDMKGCAPAFAEDYRLETVLLEALEGLEVPIALGLSSGHTPHPNVTLPLGARARLECVNGEARFGVREAPVA
ncbi:MAG TPA: LD-carboxypeptidase [Vicinamibacteria bacterium]|nr:LD-carboxypeptidase [Vicinamibacteria bacterium]